jgi:Bax protein
VELALAQAAIESGWGTSRFARDGNNLFGIWTWSDRQAMIPRDRARASEHAVKRYATPAASVRDYLLNLNSHPAYDDLRARRDRARRAGVSPDPTVLAETLQGYSERGGDYVTDLLVILNSNDHLIEAALQHDERRG